MIAPPFPDAGLCVWDAWQDLQNARQQGPAPLTYTEIDAYQRVTGTDLRPWEISVLKRIDEAYLSACHG